MPVIRLLALLAVVAVGVALVMYVLTRNKRYLHFAWTTAKVALVIVLVFFGILVIERLGLALL